METDAFFNFQNSLDIQWQIHLAGLCKAENNLEEHRIAIEIQQPLVIRQRVLVITVAAAAVAVCTLLVVICIVVAAAAAVVAVVF